MDRDCLAELWRRGVVSTVRRWGCRDVPSHSRVEHIHDAIVRSNWLKSPNPFHASRVMLRSLIALLLAPFFSAVMAAEGGWEPAIRAFEASAATVPADSVVFYGSSTFTKWASLAEDFPGLPVVNRGFGGSGTADALRYAPRVVVPLKPKWVVLYCGGNDIGSKQPETIAAATSELIAAIHAGTPQTRIVLMSLKPTVKRLEQAAQVQEVNRRYAALAKSDPLCVYLDLWTPFLAADGAPDPRYLAADQLHPSRDGYRRIASLLRPIVSPRAAP